MDYNYIDAVKEDVLEYIRNEIPFSEWGDNLEERLNDELWTVDSVTGNASGSYTFSRNKAREYVMADMDTVTEALKEFCVEGETIAEKFLNEDWEYFDVTARLYVLPIAIGKALEEMK